MKKLKLVPLALAVAMAFTTLTACQKSQSAPAATVAKGLTEIKATNPSAIPAAAKNRKDTLILGTEQFTHPYDAMFAQSQYDVNACTLMYDLLIDNDDNAAAIPNAATWTVSSDKLTYTFKLKDGIKFWDGHEATASDVAWFFYVIDDPKYDGQLNLDPDGIKGWDEYRTGKADTISGIKVVDKKTISITLEKPNAAAIWDLGLTPIIEKNAVCPDFKRGDAPKVEANTKPMGTGAYVFKSYKPGSELDLTANPNYWKGKVKIKNVIFSVTAPGQELQRLKVGEIDIEDEVPVNPDNISSLQAAKFLSANLFPEREYTFLQFQVSNPKFSDYRVRQALTYALNRDGVIKAVSKGYSKVIDIPESTTAWDYTTDGITHYSYNIDKANKLLDEAGWKRDSSGNRTKNGVKLTVDFAMTSGSKTQEAIAADMKKSYSQIGVGVTIENMDWGTLSTKATNNQLECYTMGWSLTTDPNASANIFSTTGTQNFAKYSNKTLDKLLSDQLSQMNKTTRKNTWKKIYQILNKELPETPLSQPSKLVVYNARVKGMHATTYVDYFDKLWTYSLSD